MGVIYYPNSLIFFDYKIFSILKSIAVGIKKLINIIVYKNKTFFFFNNQKKILIMD